MIFMTVGELVWLVKVEVCTFTEMGLSQLVQKNNCLLGAFYFFVVRKPK